MNGLSLTVRVWGVGTLLLLSGCAFDVSHVKQRPASFTPSVAPTKSFALDRDIKATVGSGFPTRLKAGTRWVQVGQTEYGAVFATKDQILTVESSNMYEAQLVVADGAITGFYLPVEKTFVAVSPRIPIQTNP
jgi:hypothetical protein